MDSKNGWNTTSPKHSNVKDNHGEGPRFLSAVNLACGAGEPKKRADTEKFF